MENPFLSAFVVQLIAILNSKRAHHEPLGQKPRAQGLCRLRAKVVPELWELRHHPCGNGRQAHTEAHKIPRPVSVVHLSASLKGLAKQICRPSLPIDAVLEV